MTDLSAPIELLDAPVEDWWACVRRTGILGDAPHLRETG